MLLSALLTGSSGKLSPMLLRVSAVPLTILILFLIYWLLPNRRLRPTQVILVSIITGLALELLKYLNLLTLPWLWSKLEREYGPFKNSVAIILWSFLASMIVLAGAEWSARHGLSAEREEGVLTDSTASPQRR